jgi:hypothetical protein
MTVIASGLLTAAHRNYPGAEALDRLVHQHVPMYLLHHSEDYAEHLPQGFRPLFVHIDAATAMTGVTRYSNTAATKYSCGDDCSYYVKSAQQVPAAKVHVDPAARSQQPAPGG